jgi:hypothetical protein
VWRQLPERLRLMPAEGLDSRPEEFAGAESTQPPAVHPGRAGETDGDVAGLACEELSSAGIDGEGDAVWAPTACNEAQAEMKRKDQDAPWNRREVIVFVG